MNRLPSLYDLVTEPNMVTLEFQSETLSDGGVLQGKFVRLGRIVLLAPETQVEPIPGMRSNDIQHVNIIHASLRNPNKEFSKRVIEASQAAIFAAQNGQDAERLLDVNYGLIDAGRFTLNTPERTLAFFFKSYKYGQADDAGRQETVRLAQEAIGPDITVSALDF